MSRSRKKSHFVVDHTARTTKKQKRLANKTVRRKKDFDVSGSVYKKIYPSWNICDYRYPWTKEEAIQEWYNEESPYYKGRAWRHSEFASLEKWLSYWEKCVSRK